MIAILLVGIMTAGSVMAEDEEKWAMIPVASEANAVQIAGGDNMFAAVEVPVGKTMLGTTRDNMDDWFCFTTGGTEESEYTFICSDNSLDSKSIGVRVYDEMGEELGAFKAYLHSTIERMSLTLSPDTTYYFTIAHRYTGGDWDICKGEHDYAFSVKGLAPTATEPETTTEPPTEPPTEAQSEPETQPETAPPIPETDFDISVGGIEEGNMLGYTVGKLISLGYTTTTDVNTPLASRQVTDIFPMSKDGVTYEVRAINPFGVDVPLNDSLVCYFGWTDTTGAVLLDSQIGCGRSTKTDVTTRYLTPMIDAADHVVYHTEHPALEYGSQYGDYVISEMTPACDVLFLFDQNSMCSKIAFLAPYLLYNTLADNLIGDMALMDPLALDDAMNVREDILAKLKEGFEREGIVVDIDETTGRVTMDNRILFAFDDAALSDDGKAYLDSFLRVYAEVLLNADHMDDIKSVQFDGYTDTEGTYEYNQDLSERRAQAVLDYCNGANNAGMTPVQIGIFQAIATSAGHSWDNPILGPDGSVDMDASRRVEIQFFLNVEDSGAGAADQPAPVEVQPVAPQTEPEAGTADDVW